MMRFEEVVRRSGEGSEMGSRGRLRSCSVGGMVAETRARWDVWLHSARAARSFVLLSSLLRFFDRKLLIDVVGSGCRLHGTRGVWCGVLVPCSASGWRRQACLTRASEARVACLDTPGWPLPQRISARTVEPLRGFMEAKISEGS